ncbi:hypothetical protein D3C81_2066500 [compost metagenome]
MVLLAPPSGNAIITVGTICISQAQSAGSRETNAVRSFEPGLNINHCTPLGSVIGRTLSSRTGLLTPNAGNASDGRASVKLGS